MRHLKLILLASVAKNNVVSIDKKTPWECSSIHKHFLNIVKTDPVIYNYGAYLNLDKKGFPESRNVVAVTEGEYPQVTKKKNIHFGFDLLHTIGAGAFFAYHERDRKENVDDAQMYLVGDNIWFKDALKKDYIDEMYIAHLDTEPEINEENRKLTEFFPEDITNRWERKRIKKGCSNKIKYSIYHYTLKEKCSC